MHFFVFICLLFYSFFYRYASNILYIFYNNICVFLCILSIFFTFTIVFLYTASNILILCIGSFLCYRKRGFFYKIHILLSLTLVWIVIFFIFPGYFLQYITLPRMLSHCYNKNSSTGRIFARMAKKYAAFLPRKWLKTAYFCIEDVI